MVPTYQAQGPEFSPQYCSLPPKKRRKRGRKGETERKEEREEGREGEGKRKERRERKEGRKVREERKREKKGGGKRGREREREREEKNPEARGLSRSVGHISSGASVLQHCLTSQW
jgi:hypothetical protein